jgi:hypothetical protein
MDKFHEMLGIDFHITTLETKDFADAIRSMNTITDKSVSPPIETDYRIAKYLNEKFFSERHGFFKSYDSVRTPYRFVLVPHDNNTFDRSGIHSTASVIEAYLMGDKSKVESLDDVRNISLLSFFVPVLFDARKGINSYYNEGLLEAIEYENIFLRKNASEAGIKKVFAPDFDIALTDYSVFAAFDPLKDYSGQRQSAIAFFDAVKQYKDDIISESQSTGKSRRSLPDIMKQEGIKMTVPKLTEEAIKSIK